MHNVAARWFRQMLTRVALGGEYLAERGVSEQTINRFQVGYAPNNWDSLLSYLMAQKQDLKLAAQAGLVAIGSSREYYDVFRHRILFPIHDVAVVDIAKARRNHLIEFLCSIVFAKFTGQIVMVNGTIQEIIAVGCPS